MSDDPKKLPPLPFVDDGAEVVMQQRRAQVERGRVVALRASIEGSSEVGAARLVSTPPPLPVLLTKTIILPLQLTSEGALVEAIYLPLKDIIDMIAADPSGMYAIDPRKWEEIVAGAYHASGRFDEVVLTPRSGDGGRDVIATKRGFGSIRIVESIKRYTPGHVCEAEEVRALLGVLHADHQASKGVVSTTWRFAPGIKGDQAIMQYVPHRLEFVDGDAQIERLTEYTKAQR